MNAKKAKALRQQLRDQSIYPRETEYNPIKYRGITGKISGVPLPITLRPDCGRAQYKQLKRAA